MGKLVRNISMACALINAIDVQIINFTRPEEGRRIIVIPQ